MPEVFISYAKSDRTHALDLAGELRAHGFSVWIDQGSIGGAKNWTTEIVEAINACSTFLCLLSPHSLASQNVAKELHLASEKRKNILPVMIEKVALPANFEYSLAGLQRVYFHDRPAIFQALELLHGVVATEGTPPPMERSRIQTPPPMERSGIGGGWGVVPLPEDDSIRIAVLPFDDLSPDHDNQWFADGMMDELISTLGSLERMKIPGRSDVLHYREHHKKGREISNELGVRYLIEGGVRKSNEKIRINASLTDTLRGEQLWASKFDGTFEDVFAFQESVAKDITDALKLKLTHEEKQKVEDHGTQNAEAYELYLKARHEQHFMTPEGYLAALSLYQRAIALDAKFTQAYIGIASVCCAYYRECSKNPKWLDDAQAALDDAETIAGESAKSLSIRGFIAWLRADKASAISYLTLASELDPKYSYPLNILGNIYRADENFPAAADAFQRVVEIEEDVMSYFNLLATLTEEESSVRRAQVAQKALPVFDRYLLREPGDHLYLVPRAYILLWAGRAEEAEKAAADLLVREDLGGLATYNLAHLFNQLGNPQTYIALLRKAITRGYRQIEQVRTGKPDTNDPECLREFQRVLDEFEDTIAREAAMTAGPMP